MIPVAKSAVYAAALVCGGFVMIGGLAYVMSVAPLAFAAGGLVFAFLIAWLGIYASMTDEKPKEPTK